MNEETAVLLGDRTPPHIAPPHLLPSTQKHAQPRLQRHAHRRRLRHTSSFPSITHTHTHTNTMTHTRKGISECESIAGWAGQHVRRAGGTVLCCGRITTGAGVGGGGWSCTSRRTGCRFTMSTASDRLSDETVRPRIHSDRSHISKLRPSRSLPITPPRRRLRPGLNPLSFLFFFPPSNDVTPGSKALGQPQKDGWPSVPQQQNKRGAEVR